METLIKKTGFTKSRQKPFGTIETKKIHHENAAFYISKSAIQKQYFLLQKFLPSCNHHFAVKSCPLPEVVKVLKECNAHFEIASIGEIELLKKQNIDVSNCIHTHPIKSHSEISKSIKYGIRTFVIDNESELEKFENYKNEVCLLVRIAFSNNEAKIDLSSKFGLMPNLAVDFIKKAIHKNYKIEGLSFHVGSQMLNNKIYVQAIETCKTIFDDLEKENITLNTIDIGGGFPYLNDMTEIDVKNYFSPIHKSLKKNFSDKKCISEPGRFISTPIANLHTKIIGKSERNGQNFYYINDGLYGTLSCLKYDFYDLSQIRFPKNKNEKKLCVIFGPTCDSIDKIENMMLPDLEIGDEIIFPKIGAYSKASATNFNSLSKTKVFLTY